jgi:hypothetical protein
MKEKFLPKNKLFWSVYMRIKSHQPTTTNGIEAWHRHLNIKSLIKNHNLYKYFDVLKCEEFKTNLQIDNLMKGKQNSILPKQNTHTQNILSNYENYMELEFFENLSTVVKLKIK